MLDRLFDTLMIFEHNADPGTRTPNVRSGRSARKMFSISTGAAGDKELEHSQEDPGRRRGPAPSVGLLLGFDNFVKMVLEDEDEDMYACTVDASSGPLRSMHFVHIVKSFRHRKSNILC